MAWDDMIRSVMQAAKILGKEVREQDIPVNYQELRRLHNDLWRQVYSKGGILKVEDVEKISEELHEIIGAVR